MKKLLLFVLLIAVLASGYFAYTKWFAPKTTSPWLFVPSKASIVLENSNPFGILDSIQSQNTWSAFVGLEAAQSLNDQLDFLDSLNEELGLREVLSKTQSVVAIFPTSAVEMDALVVLRLTSNQQRNFLAKAAENFQNSGNRTKKRQYNGFTIEEYYSSSNQQVLSFVRHNDLIVASFTPFLVEDAIRAFNDSEQLGFVSNYPEAFRLTALSQDHGNVYLNLHELGKLLEIFQAEEIPAFSGSGLLDVEFFSDHIKFSGFVLPSAGILPVFESGPTGFNLLEIVPNNAALVQHYSMENAAIWRDRLKSIDPEIEEAANQMKSKYDVDVDYFAGLLGSEFGNVQLEMVDSKAPDKLLLFTATDINQALELLSQAATRMTTDSVFVDRVGDFSIGKLDDVAFAKALFGTRSELMDECYYTFYQSNLVFSNSVASIKKLISSITEDNTWKKSFRVTQLLDLSSQNANLSLILNVPRSWKYLMSSMKPQWAEKIRQNETGFKSLEFVGVQFNLVDDKFYTTAVAYQPQAPKQPAKSTVADKASFSSKLITKPFVIRSHVNQALEVLLQDSSLTLYHLSNTFEILWAERLQEKIIGSVLPVDFYQNGKTQYAFATKTKLHIIDRTGKYIDGYPKIIPGSKGTEYFTVVDYDGSKNYRFMIADQSGNIILMNKEGQALGGWDPNKFEEKQILSPEHIRAAGKDAFVIVQENQVDLRSRRGESFPGFPIKFEEDLIPSRFVEATGSFGTSTITVLTEGGELVRISFNGRIEHREQLYKSSLDVTFDLIPDVLNNTFLITRSSASQWEVLDATGLGLFEKPYLNGAKSEVQFYRFGGDKALIMVTNPDGNFLTIYDLNGEVLTQRPMISDNPASVIFYENQGAYQFYLTSGNLLNKVRID